MIRLTKATMRNNYSSPSEQSHRPQRPSSHLGTVEAGRSEEDSEGHLGDDSLTGCFAVILPKFSHTLCSRKTTAETVTSFQVHAWASMVTTVEKDITTCFQVQRYLSAAWGTTSRPVRKVAAEAARWCRPCWWAQTPLRCGPQTATHSAPQRLHRRWRSPPQAWKTTTVQNLCVNNKNHLQWKTKLRSPQRVIEGVKRLQWKSLWELASLFVKQFENSSDSISFWWLAKWLNCGSLFKCAHPFIEVMCSETSPKLSNSSLAFWWKLALSHLIIS